MINYYLAIIFTLNMEIEPQILYGPMSKEECYTQADIQNRNNKITRDKQARAVGTEFACLRVERIYE